MAKVSLPEVKGVVIFAAGFSWISLADLTFRSGKASPALLYDVLGATNPFAQCAAPKFAPEKTELRANNSPS